MDKSRPTCAGRESELESLYSCQFGRLRDINHRCCRLGVTGQPNKDFDSGVVARFVDDDSRLTLSVFPTGGGQCRTIPSASLPLPAEVDRGRRAPKVFVAA